MAGGNKPPKDLTSDDEALWRKVAESVDPLAERPAGKPLPKRRRVELRREDETAMMTAPVAGPGRALSLGADLDTSWREKIRRGRLAPERSVDLHGMTRDDAYRTLMRFLGQARRDGCRVLLVITGKGRAPKEGVLKTSLPDWLAHSPHADAIMAVHKAHVSHGGAGAFYVILRRAR